MTPVTPPIPRRGWATSSLVAGILWLILAMMPVPFTTWLGLPFASWAIVVGWLSRGNHVRAGDRVGARRAGWGVGLGCLGFVWLSVVYVILTGALITAVVALFNQGTPAP